MMSLEKKTEEDVDQSTSKPKNIEEAVASHYALHVALQTMKERCQHLQQRLSTVEQENLRLRIENRKCKSDFTCSRPTEESQSTTVGDFQQKIDDLEKKVAELQRTKSYLTHHLYMVATENKQLWSRLSCLKQDNQNLGSHLSKISNTLSRHHSTSSIILSKSHSPTNSLSQGTNKEGSDLAKEPNSPFTKTPEGGMDESLQEISLKLIKSFLQEKTELEEQYAQMVEIQSDSYSIGFECLEDGDESAEDLKQHYKNLLKLRDQMLEQQTAMKTALSNLQQGGQLCSNCKAPKPKSSETNVELDAEMESLRQWGAPDENTYSKKQPDVEAMTEKICPMCGKLYNKEVPFSSFQQHVSDHFADDEDSYSIINNFEVVA